VTGRGVVTATIERGLAALHPAAQETSVDKDAWEKGEFDRYHAESQVALYILQ
jgi:hypothetical protein